MDPRRILTRGVSTGLRLGRGTADRVVTVAGPHLARVADKVVSRVRGPQPPTTTTFVPSPKATPKPTETRPAETLPTETRPARPTPATVARNAGPRPVTPSSPAKRAKPVRKSVPGAKLPPPRPSTS